MNPNSTTNQILTREDLEMAGVYTNLSLSLSGVSPSELASLIPSGSKFDIRKPWDLTPEEMKSVPIVNGKPCVFSVNVLQRKKKLAYAALVNSTSLQSEKNNVSLGKKRPGSPIEFYEKPSKKESRIYIPSSEECYPEPPSFCTTDIQDKLDCCTFILPAIPPHGRVKCEYETSSDSIVFRYCAAPDLSCDDTEFSTKPFFYVKGDYINGRYSGEYDSTIDGIEGTSLHHHKNEFICNVHIEHPVTNDGALVSKDISDFLNCMFSTFVLFHITQFSVRPMLLKFTQPGFECNLSYVLTNNSPLTKKLNPKNLTFIIALSEFITNLFGGTIKAVSVEYSHCTPLVKLFSSKPDYFFSDSPIMVGLGLLSNQYAMSDWCTNLLNNRFKSYKASIPSSDIPYFTIHRAFSVDKLVMSSSWYNSCILMRLLWCSERSGIRAL